MLDMIAEELRLGLTREEVEHVRKSLGREPNETEWAIIDAEWSEHNSYKSSKRLLRLFPTSGDRVVLGPGYDAGVVDIGDGYVVTLHIESHNHPSAVDPYGGASTGIGGVIRDILSMGSRPVALVDVLRFGRVDASAHSRWLFKNVVRGIADYGNCVGVPTVAGDIEFDESFERNCLVDVACVGLGRQRGLILGEARNPGDVIILLGGSTGRDGIRGATFASKNLAESAESERSSVQVPDPFMKKLLLDSLLEAAETGLIRGMKDLGGGGLSTALSEIASKGGTGVDVELTKVMLRENDMSPAEVMTSESQERMALTLAPEGSEAVLSILRKYRVPFSPIGRVTSDGMMKLRWNGKVVAELPARLVAEVPPVQRASRKPAQPRIVLSRQPTPGWEKLLPDLLSSPNISSRRWVYEQYDHEVGCRSVLKPGFGDAAVLRMPNDSMLAVKADGNSMHSSLDPYQGSAGCVAEACRNVVAVGGEPIAMVDHLQFGDPSDPGVYWAFGEAVRGMADYCRALGLPVVGGKVSFYNEDAASRRAIKPSPVAMVVGTIPGQTRPKGMAFREAGEMIIMLGATKRELGGSEYARLLGIDGGAVPKPDPRADGRTYRAMLKLIRDGLVTAAHDCSKGGLGVALAEMCIPSLLGAEVDLARVRGPRGLRTNERLFSETHGRFLVSTAEEDQVVRILRALKLPYSLIGRVRGDEIRITSSGSPIARFGVGELKAAWEGPLPRLMT